jgi:hypothetical protein
MPIIHNRLEELAIDALMARGINRLSILNEIREYFQKTDFQLLRKQLAEFQSTAELQMLQAAGVPHTIQDVFFTVMSVLQGKGK